MDKKFKEKYVDPEQSIEGLGQPWQRQWVSKEEAKKWNETPMDVLLTESTAKGQECAITNDRDKKVD